MVWQIQLISINCIRQTNYNKSKIYILFIFKYELMVVSWQWYVRRGSGSACHPHRIQPGTTDPHYLNSKWYFSTKIWCELWKYCLFKLNVLAAKSSFSFPFSLPPVGGGGGGRGGKGKTGFFRLNIDLKWIILTHFVQNLCRIIFCVFIMRNKWLLKSFFNHLLSIIDTQILFSIYLDILLSIYIKIYNREQISSYIDILFYVCNI